MNIFDPISLHRNRVFLLPFLLLIVFTAQGQHFEFTPSLKRAYDKLINLELLDGQVILDSIKIQDPQNKLVYHIENYVDFFTCFIDEDPVYFESIRNRKDARLKQIQSGDQSSPYFLFSQAEILLQWSLVRLKFREYVSALLEMNKAIKLLEENNQKFPDFIANKKSLSALHALIGTIPEKYKNMLSWVSSFNGSIQQGQDEINEVYSKMQSEDFIFKKEVVAIKALIELHLVNDKQLAYQTIQAGDLDPKNNPLICFIVANVSHKAGKNDEAIAIIEAFRPLENQHPLYYLDYLHGIYKLNRLDQDSDQFIRRYLNYFEGQNYIKEAYQKLAWYEWAIHGDALEYRRNMQYCASRGNDLIDEDKQALSLTKVSDLPDRNLLKARLLNDGGYQKDALQLLESMKDETRTEPQEIEYAYRAGRIAQALEKYEEAILFYEKCLVFPFDKSLYYQTAASLYIGQVHESLDRLDLAKYYYESCLSLNPNQYKSSLHQKAKAGLLRLSTR